MPLSPQDQAYWKDRLGWKAFVFLLASTVTMGCVVWPILIYATSGPGEWTMDSLLAATGPHFLLAILVSLILWFVGQLYIKMDWLPPRR